MLMSGAAPASSAGDHATIALRRRAFVSHEGGQLKLAELLYREVLGRYPDDVQVACALGILALQTQRYEWALQLLTEVYRVDQSAAVNDYIGNALCGLNRLAEALQFHERALALAPTYASAQLNRARVLRSLGWPTAAVPDDAQAREPAAESTSVHVAQPPGDVSADGEVDVQSAKLSLVPEPVAKNQCAPASDPLRQLSAAPLPRATAATELVQEVSETAPAVAEVALDPEPEPEPEESAPTTTEIAQDIGEYARVAAETALATSERALAATEGAESMLAPVDSASASARTAGAGRWSNVWSRTALRVEQDHLAPVAVSCVLALLLCAEVVHAAKIVIWHGSPQPLEAPLSARNLPRPTSVDVARIAASHLFGEVPGVQDTLAAPRSAANLKLSGTLATTDPRHGLAIIGDPAKSQVYSIGDSSGDFSLVAIYRDRVVIARNGALESLFLPRTENRDQSSTRPISSAVAALANPAAATAPEEEPLINRYADSNPETDVAGSLLGIRVVPGKDREAFANSGLIGGDIVVALNGMKLDSERGQDTWKQAGTGSTVTVLRRGVMKEVTLNFSP
jgi:general secretion pathway protein C